MKAIITYKIGDNVWLMHGNHTACATVVKVSYKKFISSANYESVIKHEVYTLSVNDKPLPGLYGEDELFPTKADLIKSL